MDRMGSWVAARSDTKSVAGLAQLNAQRRQAGFTIIETLLFLVVSALLMAIVLNFQGQATRDARFTDSTNTLLAELNSLQSDQFSTASLSAGKNASIINFMTVVAFTPNSPTVRVRKCTTSRTAGPIASGFNCTNAYTFDLKWDSTHFCNPGSCPRTILFFRHHNTGDLKTVSLTVDGSNDANIASAFTTQLYDSINVSETQLLIKNTDNSHQATIFVNQGNRINQMGRQIR